MIKIFKAALTIVLTLGTSLSYAQGKYFEVACEKGTFGNEMIAMVRPLQNKPYVILTYKNKTQKQLNDVVHQYLKNRPGLKLDHDEPTFLVYRDFATVGNKEKCFADLVALSYIYVIPEADGTIKISLGLTSHIYATIFDAKLKISPGGDVVSDSDLPFNIYQYVQPADERVLTSNVWTGTRSKKRELKSAYPDSVFDPAGKVVNAQNKKMIEAFFDGYIDDLKTYIDSNLK